MAKTSKTKTITASVVWHHFAHPHRWDFAGHTPYGAPVVEVGYPSQESSQDSLQNHGPDRLTSPKELLLQAMASCSGMDVVSTLEKMRETLEDFSIEVQGEQDEEASPKVFCQCTLNYNLTGTGLNPVKVARAVFLSLTKYCGVSAMVRRSGAQLVAHVRVNGQLVNLWDPGEQAQKLTSWLSLQGDKKIALVVGASRGIGHALCPLLAGQGYAVIPVTRSPVRFEDPNIFESLYADFTLEESLYALGDLLKSTAARCDLVVYCGAILDPSPVEELSSKELRHTYETNVFGPLTAHNILKDVLKKESVCAFFSSIMGHKIREDYDHAAYRLSKATVTQLARQLALQAMATANAQVFLSLHPGSVATEMNPRGKIPVERSAQKIAELLSPGHKAQLQQNNGAFWSLEGVGDGVSWVVR